MDKVNIIVFSKDRAIQLELFLRSFNRFVKDASLYRVDVLFTYSTLDFKAGYDKLKAVAPPNVVFHKEINFQDDVVWLINKSYPYTVFFVDDIIFKEPFEFFDQKMSFLDVDKDIACVSLRLNPHLTYCYAENRPMRRPVFDENLIFNWTKEMGDYGYPMSQDGHIFRTSDIYQMHADLSYTGPNMLEGKLHHQRGKMGHKMICYEKSKIVNNPINRVQYASQNRCGNISAESLNEKYLAGYVIDLEPFVGFDNTAVHTEITPSFVKE